MQLTKTKFNSLIEEAKNILEDLGYEIPNYTYEISNTKRIAGQCNYTKKKITVSAHVAQYMDEKKVLNTCVHEIIHALAPNSGHTGKWLKIAAEVNRTFQLGIERTYKAPKEMTEAKPYAVQCCSCNTEIGRLKMSNVIRYPNAYKCKCGGQLERIR